MGKKVKQQINIVEKQHEKNKQIRKTIKRTKTIEATIKESKNFNTVKRKVKQQDNKAENKKVLQKQKKQNIKKKKVNKKQKNQKTVTKEIQVQQQIQINNQNQNQNEQQKQNIIRRTSSFANKKFKFEDIPKYLNTEILQENILELDDHNNFKEKYLGKEGCFSAYKVIVGQFYNGFDFHQNAGNELKRRGFEYYLTQNQEEFLKKIMDYDIAWIISGMNPVSPNFVKSMGQFMQAKKSLYLWADNAPYKSEADAILQNYFVSQAKVYDTTLQNYIVSQFKMGLSQDWYMGTKILTKSENLKLQKGEFLKNHAISYGLNNLYEGHSIPKPENIHPDFTIYALNSNGDGQILYAEENDQHGRIILDTGFTKLYGDWDSAGTSQYISNANVWLTGIPQ